MHPDRQPDSSHAHTTRVIAGTRASPFHAVVLRIHSIHCDTPTGEVDRDEIVLAAIKLEGAVEQLGGRRELTARVASDVPLDAGQFKAGDARHYGEPRIVALFSPGEETDAWPRHYSAILLMLEKDEGAIGDVVSAAVKSVDREVKAAVAKAVAGTVTTAIAAGAAAGSALPLVGMAIGTAAGALAGLAMAEIRKAHHDDVLEPAAIHFSLPGSPVAAGEIPGSRKTIGFRGSRGAYQVSYSWAMG